MTGHIQGRQLRQQQPIQQQQMQQQQIQQRGVGIMSEARRTLTENRYHSFLQNLATPPAEVQVPEQNPYRQPAAGRKERRRQRKKLESMGRKNTLMSAEDMQELAQNKTFTDQKMRKDWEAAKNRQSQISNLEVMQQLAAGDYSNFENVQPVIKNVAASRKYQEFRRNYPAIAMDGNFPAEELVQQMKAEHGVSALMDPALRLGLSLARHTEDVPETEKENCRRLDEAMSRELMYETLTHVEDSNTYTERLIRECGVPEGAAADVANRELSGAMAQQTEIAKRLLLMQLSDFKVYDKQGNASAWDAPVAVALSHCRRIVLTMPTEQTQGQTTERAMWNSIFHTANNFVAADRSRTASTHSLKRRKVRAEGRTKEKKVLVNLIGQRGMNCAIGGIGNTGISGKMIRNNGSCGHFYSMYKEGTGDSYGAILFGLESDAAGVVNQMGHKHDHHAKPEAASSLGGQRVDEIGADYGGRQCDLTHLTPAQITAWMNALETKLSQWNETKDPRKQEVMRLLTGRKLTAEEIGNLKQTLGVE